MPYEILANISTRRWPLQQINTTQGRARLPPLGTTMEAFRRQVSGTGAKKKKPEPVTRDAYGFVVRPVNPKYPQPPPVARPHRR